MIKITIKIIPKIHFRDKSTYFDEKVLCIPSNELYRKLETNKVHLEKEYFIHKDLIISSIFPDENEFSYTDYLEKLPYKNNYFLMSVDCATYEDSTEEIRNDELFFWREENLLLKDYLKDNAWEFQRLKLIGLLKGIDNVEYKESFDFLEKTFNPKSYLIYLSGNIRSNPGHFNAYEYLKKIFPGGFHKPLFLYGFNPGSIQDLKLLKLHFSLVGVISETYHANAIYRSNLHYSRKVRMKKSWEKYKKLFEVEK